VEELVKEVKVMSKIGQLLEDPKKLDEMVLRDKERAKQQMLLRQIRKKYDRLLKDTIIQEEILELCRAEIVALPKVTIPPKKKIKKGITKEECILLLGDLHIGEVVSFEEMGGFGSYDTDVFSARMEKLFDKTIDLVSTKMQGYSIEKINVIGLGDFVTGIIHEELIETASDSVIEWTLGGALVVSQFLIDLSRHFKQVEFTGVVGNHGRMNKKPRFKHRYINWDYLLYQIVSLMCAQQKNIKFDLPKCFFTLKEIAGHNNLILHGDNIKMYKSIPWYGIERTINELSQLLSAQNIMFQNVFLGHFHNQGMLNKVTGEIILNGSVIGGNEYSLGRLFRSSDPMQLLMGINPKYGITWRFPINLKNAKVKDKPRYNYSTSDIGEGIKGFTGKFGDDVK